MTQTASPDPRLKKLDKLLGTWELTHKDLDTGEEWLGRDTFEWLDGGYFMAMQHEEFDRLKGTMIIGNEIRWGHDKPTEDLMGHWFETSSEHHYDYIWEVDDKNMIFWPERKHSDSAFKGVFNDDCTEVKGTWRWPGGGYELTMRKVQK
ncbi:MAG TPA: hypothetical protein VIH22_02035 [Cyclobacteriaceae bacterium]